MRSLSYISDSEARYLDTLIGPMNHQGYFRGQADTHLWVKDGTQWKYIKSCMPGEAAKKALKEYQDAFPGVEYQLNNYRPKP